MIQITKNQCPGELKKYSKKKGASYGGIPEKVKQSLRNSLLVEQGFLCAYCMCRISSSECKIEHFHCRDKHLVYGNLLVCCVGGKKGKEKHCDSAKGNKDITCSPLDPACIKSLYYDLYDGTIHSSNDEWNKELNDVLQLNIDKLKQLRKQALDGLIESLKLEADVSTCLQEAMNRNADGHLPPFCGILRYYLIKVKGSANT